MGGFGLGIIGIALIWFGLQLTISPALKSDIEKVRAAVEAAPPPASGGIGPVVVSSDVCNLLTAGKGAKRSFARLAFFTASRSADALRARYRFEAVTPCQRGGENAVVAYEH